MGVPIEKQKVNFPWYEYIKISSKKSILLSISTYYKKVKVKNDYTQLINYILLNFNENSREKTDDTWSTRNNF